MSLLAPLYLIGALAIGLPIIAHLIRRRPKAEMTFSSLMFLRESPPQLTKRSRLDQLPLLLLRILALALLAIAFARPFLRDRQSRDADTFGRRLVLMIDTSASMRRAGIANQVSLTVDAFTNDLRNGDAVAVMAFDSSPKVLLDFQQSGQLGLSQLRQTINDLASETAPTWYPTELGRALAAAAEFAESSTVDQTSQPETGGDTDTLATKSPSTSTTLVVVSDLHGDSGIQQLKAYAWPKQVSVDVRQVSPTDPTNATCMVVHSPPQRTAVQAGETQPAWKVRVVNASESRTNQFHLALADEDGLPRGKTKVAVQVPPGSSRVVAMIAPLPGDASILLQGDEHPFDNAFYFATPEKRSLTLMYFGAAVAESRDDPAYYLKKLPLDTPRRTVAIEALDVTDRDAVTAWSVKFPQLSPTAIPLVVIAQPLPSNLATPVQQYVRSGGRALLLVQSAGDFAAWQETIRQVADWDAVTVSEARVGDYAMLSQIDFRNSLFETMADPQFNDFSKIRIWKHRRIDGFDDDALAVAATFDNGSPALVSKDLGDGTVWVMACGWQPADSQLALSTKFLPMMFKWLDPKAGRQDADASWTIGVDSSTSLADLKNETDLPAFDQPGVYRLSGVTESSPIAANMDRRESAATTIDVADLEPLGVQLGAVATQAELQTRQRQLRDVELERDQSLWRALLIVVLAVLGIETIWSGWRGRRLQQTEVSPSTNQPEPAS